MRHAWGWRKHKTWRKKNPALFIPFGDQEYEFGFTETGLARAIRRMSELRREIQTEVS